MKFVVIDIQGFNLLSAQNEWKFYPKEITITNGFQANHYLLKPPLEFKKLSARNKKQVRYEEKHIHGLRYSSGNIQDIHDILIKLLSEYDVVYVKGQQKHEYLMGVCAQNHQNIINVEGHEFWNIPTFKAQKPRCLDHLKDKHYSCSNTNSSILYQWILNFFPHGHAVEQTFGKYQGAETTNSTV